MAVHAYHEELPGYSPEAILHHGCDECADRAGIHGLAFLDWKNSRRAVERAIKWNRGELFDVNETEAGLLNAIWTMLVFIQANTEIDPIDEGLPWKDFEAIERSIFGR